MLPDVLAQRTCSLKTGGACSVWMRFGTHTCFTGFFYSDYQPTGLQSTCSQLWGRPDKSQPGMEMRILFQSRRLRRKVYALCAEVWQGDQDNDTCVGVDWAVQSLWTSWWSVCHWNRQGARRRRPRYSILMPQKKHAKHEARCQNHTNLATTNGSLLQWENRINPQRDGSSAADPRPSKHLRVPWMFRCI